MEINSNLIKILNLIFRKRRKKSYARWWKIKWTYEVAMQNQKSQTYCGFNWYFYPGRCANGSISTQGNLVRLETKVAHCNKIRDYINTE